MNKGAPLSLARLISEIEKHAPGPQAALDRAIARGENLTLVFPLFTHWLQIGRAHV